MPVKTVEPSTSTDAVVTRFRARLLRRRDEAELSRRELAKRAGLDQSTIARLELGDRMPSLGVSVALAEALGTSVPDLFPVELDLADLAAMELARLADAERLAHRLAHGAGAEMWPMRTRLAVGQGRRCCWPLEPCTCRSWVAPAGGMSDADATERMDA